MPKARPLTGYPVEAFKALFTRARSEPVLVPLTKPQALTLRGELYAFRRAARADQGEAARWGVDLDGMEQVAFRVVEEGLQAYPMEQSAAALAIVQALGQPLPTAQPRPAEDEAAASLARLRAMTGASNGE
jgi:hypothetical protein